MTPKKQTPLQEAIQTIIDRLPTKNRNTEYRNTLLEAHEADIELLESLLPKEQQTFCDIFDAGEKYGYAEGATETDPHPLKNPYPNKETFLNQYKPEE